MLIINAVIFVWDHPHRLLICDRGNVVGVMPGYLKHDIINFTNAVLGLSCLHIPVSIVKGHTRDLEVTEGVEDTVDRVSW